MTMVSSRQLAWLEAELAGWQAEGLVTDEAAAAIRSRYVAGRRLSLITVLVGLGAAFVAVGVIWLVAANLDQLSPLLRFALVVVLWLGLVVAAELLAEHHTGERASPLVGAARLLAAAAFGAVIFQAAQSLQVPAYTATLIGWWALGALLYAYAVDGVAPLILGVVTATVWFAWQSAEDADGVRGFALALLLGSVVATAAAIGHSARWRAHDATPWRLAGATLALVGLFVAALPWFETGDHPWTTTPIVVAVLAGGCALAAGILGNRLDRAELGVIVAAAGAGIGLLSWVGSGSGDEVDTADTLRAVVAVLIYLLVAGALAVIGTRRDLPALTGLATAALVVFTTVQSFAVFARIITGATLFLAVGVVLLASGFGFDRARRRLVVQLAREGDRS
ncbi:MAG: DUF2157 domain-containing protein [Kineosporiaceae bacterium]